MKTNLLCFMLCLWTFDNFSKPKPKKGVSPQETTTKPVEPNDQDQPPSIPREASEKDLDSIQSDHSSPLTPKRSTSPEKKEQQKPTTVTPETTDWVEAHTELTPDTTPLSDLIKSWQMWFKEKVQDPKLQERLKRFFNLTKTYEIFSEELVQCPANQRQETFDNLIKAFNTDESPLFGYELLSEAITQAINDKQETKLYLLIQHAMKHRKHLPPAVLEQANNFLKSRNNSDIATTAAELASVLQGIHRRAELIKGIERPESPLNPLSEENAESIALREVQNASSEATKGFIQPRITEKK